MCCDLYSLVEALMKEALVVESFVLGMIGSDRDSSQEFSLEGVRLGCWGSLEEVRGIRSLYMVFLGLFM